MQTLFRFTSLRNPELAQTKGNYGFINRPNFSEDIPIEEASFFNKVLEEKTNSEETKLAYLTSRAKEFKNQPNYVSSIDDLGRIVNLRFLNNVNIYDDEYKPYNTPSLINSINDLWDNLIYQVLTEENFYLKEKIVEIFKKENYNNLGLYHIVEGQTRPIFTEDETERRKKLAREARVVLPEELFVESSGTKRKKAKSAKINALELQELKQKAEKDLLLSKAKADKVELEQLKSELTKAQSDYNKGYGKALKLAQETYQKSIKLEEENYDLALLETEANLPSETTEAQRKLALAKVSKPNFPDFNFEYTEQLDTTFLEDKLSSKTRETLVDVVRLSNEFTVENDPVSLEGKTSDSLILDPNEYETLADVLIAVENKIKKQEELIIAHTEVEQEQYVNIGGVFLPVSNKSLKLQLPKYNLCTKEIDKSFRFDIDFSFYLSDQSFVIKDVIYSTTDIVNSYTFTGDKFTLLKEGNRMKLTNLQTENLNDFKEFPVDDYLFNIKINFTNGLSYDFIDIPIVLNACTQQNGSNDDGFIPSGFGVRRLGIADYLKIEQSTHAYVPGEVAHIENIMAREYREKSTRRTRRTEDTTTSSSESEREQLTDTTTATRFDMQTEIAKMMAETTDASTSVSSNKFAVNMGASFAHSRSKDESSRTAVTQAKDITERALDRIVSKVKEERVRKVVEEFEENNMHGFDNRKGDKNVVGVYRWVDKIMKNQIFNYGKRLTFEFMIPQPSKIHRLAMMDMNPKKIIEKPVDPRVYKKGTLYNLEDFSKISPFTLQFWGAYYNVELTNYSDEICIGKAFSFTTAETNKAEYDEAFAKDDFIEIPEGYKTTKGKASVSFPGGDPHLGLFVTIGDKIFKIDRSNNPQGEATVSSEMSLSSFENSIPVSMSLVGLHAGNVNVEVKCVLTDYGRRLLFNQIISAYEEALSAYEQKVKDAEEEATLIKETNANFYRQIESDVLRHNCMAYLVDPDKLGSQLYTGNDLFDFSIKKDEGMDEYASLVKFMEQAFEWDIMSYNFYPYYWGSKTEWQDLYQSESIDPLFRSFLQSGMARVVVTVKPGFEDAVQFYMSTGKIWNGGEVPVIGDPMYISLVEEMREPVGDKVGKFWLTKLPTSLNVLQAESIGLTVEQALPFTKEIAAECENPEMIVEKAPFTTTKSLLNGGTTTGGDSGNIVEVEEVISGDWTDTTSVD